MSNDSPQHVYEELALRYERQQDARQRDLFLVLAADAALSAGRAADAERLRNRLLELSPHSLLRPYASFADSLKSTDIQEYIADLRRLFPPAQAAKLLAAGNGKKETPAPATYPLKAEAAPRTVSVRPAMPAARHVERRSPYVAPAVEQSVPPAAEGEATGGWIAVLVFLLAFLGALSLAAYVLVRPFLR